VEAASGGGALVAKLKSLGYKVKNTQDLADLARAGDREVIKLIAEAASYLGKAIADAINLFNPRKIIIEGRIVESTDLYLSTLKEVIYKRAAALATKDLEIVQSKLGNDRALLGAAQLGIEQFFFKVN
jgi:predicted NBD/HSP70 family sugar kinase